MSLVPKLRMKGGTKRDVKNLMNDVESSCPVFMCACACDSSEYDTVEEYKFYELSRS